ncbi:response regulator [Caballeronia sp. 15715]|uniref:response regulator n=1 Tax=Caballeronia sp. 15715 TaxID=3391030 RepID=UPI0039E6F82E
MNVLFVDDNPDSADALASLAAAMGHEASVAYGSQGAVALARATTFDLILLDIKLGEADGRDVCADIRREGASQHSQILAMTGHVGLEQGVSLGDFNGYVLKPIEFDRLEELLTS